MTSFNLSFLFAQFFLNKEQRAKGIGRLAISTKVRKKRKKVELLKLKTQFQWNYKFII